MNQLYFKREIHRKVHEDDESSRADSPDRQVKWTKLASGVPSVKCQKKHRHANFCSKAKETDLSLLQSRAFKYLMLQKPMDEPTGFEPGALYRASFFPRAKLPTELL